MHASVCRHLRAALVAGFVLVGLESPSFGAVESEAVLGMPFGVGRVTVALTDRDAAALQTNAFALVERDGRALYPVFTPGGLRRLLADVLGAGDSEVASSITAWFLFTGEAPLRLTLFTSEAHAVTVVPQAARPRARNRLLRTWWRQYSAAARQQARVGDYPPLVETYLTAMLGRRLGLEPPLLSRLEQPDAGEAQQTLQLLLGVEKLRTAVMRETMLGRSALAEPPDRPVPPEIEWLAPVVAPPPEPVEIEPLALHVPQECFYVRFGTFANYLWLSHLLEEFGGDISRMVNLRGHDAGLDRKIQQQIALRQTTLGELLGGQVIADVAMIGRDLYLREGAAFGMLFQAKNGLLASDLNRQRQAALKEHEEQGATIKTVQIAGRDVSLLSTPDNRLRSYYAIDGAFHLVTTSRAIVERFFQCGQGRGALGTSAEFRHARRLMPTGRNDTVFIYLSSAFFRGLVGPQYQIELARRIQSVTDLELVQIARLAARAEGTPGQTIEDLVAARLLPAGFGRRPDGSGPILTDDGVIDSLRGARGSFTPVADVALRRVTRSEEARYLARAAYYQTNWRQMDPVMIGIRRYALDRKGKERVVIDANVWPLAEQKYGWLLALLGPPTPIRITPAPGDIITAQMSVKGGLLFPAIPAHHLFAGVQDVAPPPIDLRPTGFFKTLQILQTTPGYLGAWPQLGFLDLLPLGLAGQPDAQGFSRLPLGVWRRQFDGFSVLSFDPRMLADVTPHLRPVETPTAAQIRIHVGDLSQSRLTGWINALSYQRAVQTTLGNVRLLNALTQQLHVPPEAALATAQRLLDAKLVCSLGGRYELAPGLGGRATWHTSALPELPVRRVPDDYQSPILKWFRGLEADLTKTEGRLTLHAQLDMQRQQPETKILLPLFNLFGQAKKKQAGDKPRQPESVQPSPPARSRKGPREF